MDEPTLDQRSQPLARDVDDVRLVAASGTPT